MNLTITIDTNDGRHDKLLAQIRVRCTNAKAATYTADVTAEMLAYEAIGHLLGLYPTDDEPEYEPVACGTFLTERKKEAFSAVRTAYAPFGEMIRSIRLRSQKSMGDLAESLGVTVPEISAWERGVFLIPEEYLQAVLVATTGRAADAALDALRSAWTATYAAGVEANRAVERATLALEWVEITKAKVLDV